MRIPNIFLWVLNWYLAFFLFLTLYVFSYLYKKNNSEYIYMNDIYILS